MTAGFRQRPKSLGKEGKFLGLSVYSLGADFDGEDG